MTTLRTLALTSLLAACSANAAVVGITNGNFDTQSLDASGGYADEQTITDWFDSTGGYTAWMIKVPGSFVDGSVVGSGATNHLGLTSDSAWAYQQIGTYTGNETVTVSGDALNRGGNNSFQAVTFQLYRGAFTGADGTDLTGLTLLDTQTLTKPGDFTDGTARASSFSLNFSTGAGGTNGEALWLRLSTSAGGETYLDNLAAVPEPSTFGLFGASAIGLAFSRRRK